MINNLKDGFHVASMVFGPINTNSHILYQNAKAMIIDAPLGSLKNIRDFLLREQLEPQALLLTHGHWDHMGDAAVLRQAFQFATWGSRHDSFLFQNPQIMSAFAGNVELQPVVIDHPLDVAFNQKSARSSVFSIEWAESSLEIEAYAMPGHTPGGIAFYFPQAGCVMTGDQLFRDSVGRSDLPGGNFELLSASIRESLYRLPTETRVFPGHGGLTTIGYEMQHNPFVRINS